MTTPAPKPPAAPKPTPPAPKVSVLEALLKPHFKLDEARADLQRLHGAFGGGIPEQALRQWVHAHFRDSDSFWMALARQWEREIA